MMRKRNPIATELQVLRFVAQVAHGNRRRNQFRGLESPRYAITVKTERLRLIGYDVIVHYRHVPH